MAIEFRKGDTGDARRAKVGVFRLVGRCVSTEFAKARRIGTHQAPNKDLARQPLRRTQIHVTQSIHHPVARVGKCHVDTPSIS
jgi:hypothetical protein